MAPEKLFNFQVAEHDARLLAEGFLSSVLWTSRGSLNYVLFVSFSTLDLIYESK